MPYNPDDDPVADRAAFAQRFKNTTDLDQRRRFAQDITTAKQAEDDRLEAEFQAEQQRNPKLMDAVTKRMAEQRNAREGAQRRDLSERRFTWEQEKAGRMDSISQKKLELQQLQEMRLVDKADRELTDAIRSEKDTNEFVLKEGELRDRGFLPGSAEYRDGLLNIAARHPYVDPQFRRTLFEGSKIQMDADELQGELAQLQAQNPNASITLGADGRPTFRVSPARADKPKDLQAELDKAFAARDRAKQHQDEDYRKYTEERIASLQSQMKGQAPAQVAKPAIPETPGQAAVLTLDVARSLLKEAGGDKDKARTLAKERGYQQ